MRYYRSFISLLMVLSMIIPFNASSQEIDMIYLTQIELVTVGENEIGLTWVTNLPSDTKVEYGRSDSLGTQLGIPEETNFHYIMMEGLDPGVEYFFRVGSGSSWSSIMNTTTISPDGSSEGITIALVGDSHIDVDGTTNNAGFLYGESEEILTSAVEQLNDDPEIDRVIFLGDMVNGAEDDYGSFKRIISGLDIPWEFTFGNWEKDDENWEGLAGEYLDLERTYYSTDIGSFHLIFLDSALQGEVAGSIDDEQFQWLEKDLEDHPFEPTILVMHHPLEDEGIFTVDDNTRNKLNSIMGRNGQVISVIAGHNHKNRADPVNGRYHCSVASLVQYPIGYSKIRLYSSGYSQHFLKVEDEMGSSEESKLKIDTSSGSRSAHQEYLGPISERSWFYRIPTEHVPVIDSVSLSPEAVHAGDEISVEVEAYDPGHGILEISYFLDGESLSQTGPSITLKAPDETGGHELKVLVNSKTSSVSTLANFTVVYDSVAIDNPPVISDLKVSKKEAYPGDSVTITVDALDPDDDPIKIIWYMDGDQFYEGTGSFIRWTAPDEPGIYEFKVRVQSGPLYDEETASIKVIPREEAAVIETESAPFPGFGALLLVLISFVLIQRYRKRKE